VSETQSQTGLKESYFQLIDWLQAHPNFGYWICLLAASFILLSLVYLLFTNLRLHRHIRILGQDKKRLMQEKDMMRKGMDQNSEA
jgi:hypothetical protein